MKVSTRTVVHLLLVSALHGMAPAQGMEWSTFVGGPRWDSSSVYHGVTTFPGGDVLLVGGTMSAMFPTTADAYQKDHGGSMGLNIGDAFLMRVRSDGSGIVWATFFGGSADDMATSVVIHPDETVTIVGWTNSTDLPVTRGAFQTVFGGQPGQGPGEAFVAHFDPNETGEAQLVWATYLGADREGHRLRRRRQPERRSVRRRMDELRQLPDGGRALPIAQARHTRLLSSPSSARAVGS